MSKYFFPTGFLTKNFYAILFSLNLLHVLPISSPVIWSSYNVRRGLCRSTYSNHLLSYPRPASENNIRQRENNILWISVVSFDMRQKVKAFLIIKGIVF
jgi:hypothetical protein